jgi:hypothetical protein
MQQGRAVLPTGHSHRHPVSFNNHTVVGYGFFNPAEKPFAKVFNHKLTPFAFLNYTLE